MTLFLIPNVQMYKEALLEMFFGRYLWSTRWEELWSYPFDKEVLCQKANFSFFQEPSN